MDLRSAHKVPDTPRLRLSLTRSMGSELDQGSLPYRAGEGGSVYRRLARRKNKQRVSKPVSDNNSLQPLTRIQDPMEHEWQGAEERPESDTRENSLFSLFSIKHFMKYLIIYFLSRFEGQDWSYLWYIDLISCLFLS